MNFFNTKENTENSNESKSDKLNLNTLFSNHLKQLNYYNYLDNKKKQMVDKTIPIEICKIIKEFIPHFANFNYEISESIDLLVDLSSKFKLEKEKINYYVTYLNSNFFTIKNKSATLTSKGFEITKTEVKSNKMKDFKIDSIISSLNFLDDNSKIHLTEVNKIINIKFKKKIFHKILKNIEQQKDVPYKFRLSIWKNILNVVKY